MKTSSDLEITKGKHPLSSQTSYGVDVVIYMEETALVIT